MTVAIAAWLLGLLLVTVLAGGFATLQKPQSFNEEIYRKNWRNG
jgi:hypothetical protein